METVAWAGDRVRLLDQTRLPLEEVYLDFADYRQLAAAIREMRVRGAPAIGVTAAYGVALAALEARGLKRPAFDAALSSARDTLAATRPTAVNLFWALGRMAAVAAAAQSVADAVVALVAEAQAIHAEDLAASRRLGRFGAELLPQAGTVLTHCNAGSLATAGYGTALGVVRAAVEAGKEIQVFADETRPLLQGARLTAWELQQDGIPVTLIADTMAGHFMSRGAIDCVVVGADRIAANGDVANKIGTYQVAVLAKEHGIPFYVAAPWSTVDLAVASGSEIPIEERAAEEVTSFGGRRTAPPGVAVRNPAFDVTPARFVTAIITDRGVARAPYAEQLARLAEAASSAEAARPEAVNTAQGGR
ncbi:MAG TPA: S-methyl-5-thioribose-1-phosphate isomerase [Dehalococcoidia bacterium]|nr:S-methyl-5-thioribose-1-phosphate isomerase [Dehalococcoidia bacterium]